MGNVNDVWARRLKQARIAAGISQKTLGIEAGLDPFVASTRINRYELGVHKADYKIAQALAKILNVPTSYFYEEDDDLAEIMLSYHRMTQKTRQDFVRNMKKITKEF